MIDLVFLMILIGFLVTSTEHTPIQNKTLIRSPVKTDQIPVEQTINCALKCRSLQESARLTLITKIQNNISTQILHISFFMLTKN